MVVFRPMVKVQKHKAAKLAGLHHHSEVREVKQLNGHCHNSFVKLPGGVHNQCWDII